MRGSRRRTETLTVEPEEEDTEENLNDRNRFFACYLLCSLCPRFKGHTYIGFTVNPRRRIRQHNGEIKCGAWRTKSKRPWEMVLCIHGFPSKVSALQFEWAWQHPRESKAVREAALTFKSLSGLAIKIKLAYTMLALPQWEGLDLSVNLFSSKYTAHLAHCPRLPKHMKTTVLPMDELPCYSDNPVLDNEDDDHVLERRETCHFHEPIFQSHPGISESCEMEPTTMKVCDDGRELEQDHERDLQRRDNHIYESISHEIEESDEEASTWMKICVDSYEMDDDRDHDLQEEVHIRGAIIHPRNAESGEEPSWIKIQDDGYEMEEDRDYDLLGGDHFDGPENVKLDEGSSWVQIRDDDYELVGDQDHDHDFIGKEDHSQEPVSLSHPKNVESDEVTASTKIHEGSYERYHDHGIHKSIPQNPLQNIESDEEKEHHLVPDIRPSISLTHPFLYHDVEGEDNIHESISLSDPKIVESGEGQALTRSSNLGQGSMTTCQRGATLLDVIDLSTPPSCRVGCKRGKLMTSICREFIDLTRSPV